MRYNKYIVIYDIISSNNEEFGWKSLSNKRRAKIARILLEYGIRVQKSVFEIEVSANELKQITRRINHIKLIKNNIGDKIYIYPIENKVKNKIIYLGKENQMLKHIFI